MLQDKSLLILDEATSALDSENEALVQKSLENLWRNRTVISIAHRLSTLKKMDRILVFDNGEIIEDGSIEKLLKNKGAFYELWNHQVNGMIID
jgi:ABC-type multidrug transport system fused ATPase/permease subunit